MNSKPQRAKKVLFICMLLLTGCVAGLLLAQMGCGIPCIFHLLTGWECPGCGITRLLGSLLRGDIGEAWRYNPFLFITAPVLLLLLMRLTTRYIAEGRKDLNKWENIAVWILVICAALFGIMRNLPIYPYD